MKNRKVIVTGGAGFIGTNLVGKLVNDNEVLVIDNLHTGSNQNLKEFESENLKVVNDDAKSIVKMDFDADVVFHLGFYSASPMYRDNPMLVSEVVGGMLAVLNSARDREIPVVFTSTSSINNGVTPPHREDIIPAVTDLYTEARIAAERLGLLYHKLHGLSVSAMRFFSVYGYHEKAKGQYANLATQFLWAMKRGESPIIYGDGEQRRDFIFAEDVADALIRAADIRSFEVFNVGCGRNYSLKELVEKLNNLLGTTIEPKYVDMPVKNYVMETLADTAKMKTRLGFEPKVTFDKGLELINEYYK